MKKQLNYKSLNTLGDVDITQSVVPGGGTAESGDWHYFDVSALDSTSKKSVIQMGMLHKVQGEKIESLLGVDLIVPTGFGYMIPIDITEIKAVATDFATKIQLGEQIVTIGESITTAPWYGQVPEITKEQFYKLPVALTIYGPTEDAAIDYEDKMKTSFDTLWTIWERDGIDGQDLDITIPNADIASVTLINNEGTFAFNITSIKGVIKTYTSEIINSIRFNGQYGATLSKKENLTTGKITYEYESMG